MNASKFPPIKTAQVADLIPYARNSRTHSDEQVTQIAASIKEFGFLNPVIVDGENGIIAGHGRVMAAKKLGMTELPAVEASHLTDAQRRAYIIADNKLALNAGWDDEMLRVEFAELSEAGFDLDLTGFSLDEIGALQIEEILPGLTDEDAVPDVPVQPVTVEGDVWLLGRHRLMCGDSTSIDAVERLMDGRRADFCFTSPPYADQREYNGGKELSTEYLATFIRSSSAICDFFAINLGLSRKAGEINTYWDDYITEAKNCGLKLVSWNIWDRSGEGGSIGNMTAAFPINHEWIFVFAINVPELNRTIPNKHGGKGVSATIRGSDSQFAERQSVVHEFGKLGTVLKCGVQRGKNEHPAMFPVNLPEIYIDACTKRNGVVYEPFGGSGTTLIACEKTNRDCRMMELDPKYCDVIIKRWQDFTGKQATLEATGETFEELTNVRLP
jgi:DNA modification methylase